MYNFFSKITLVNLIVDGWMDDATRSILYDIQNGYFIYLSYNSTLNSTSFGLFAKL